MSTLMASEQLEHDIDLYASSLPPERDELVLSPGKDKRQRTDVEHGHKKNIEALVWFKETLP